MELTLALLSVLWHICKLLGDLYIGFLFLLCIFNRRARAAFNDFTTVVASIILRRK